MSSLLFGKFSSYSALKTRRKKHNKCDTIFLQNYSSGLIAVAGIHVLQVYWDIFFRTFQTIKVY